MLQLDFDTEDHMIGGPGIVVEIDESKFGKRKGNVGHRVEGVWVVGGVERTPERRMFAVTVVNRNAATLKGIIESHVQAGSIVYTDCWRGYRDEDLRALGMDHDTVNHTYNFVDPVTGVHTNHIEGTWYALKHTATPVRHRSPNYVVGDICTFMWKRRHAGDLWNAFLAALARVIFENDDFNAVDDEIAVDPAAAAGDEALEEEADDQTKED